jgi:hypothetical protein
MGADSSPTGSPSPAGSTPGSVRSISGAGNSSASDGLECLSSPMCEPSELSLFPELTSSPAVSPARVRALRASARASHTPRRGSGERWLAPLAIYDPDTCLWRMSRTSLPSMTEPSGEPFSETWPRSGTTVSGTAYRRQPLAPRTSVTGLSPLLPTPTRAAGEQGPGSTRGRAARQGSTGRSLNETVRMLRTPTSAPWNQGGAGGEQQAQIQRLLPTPRANIAKQGLPREGNWGELRAEVMSLLPTPAATEGGYHRSPSDGAAIRPQLGRLPRSRGASTDPQSDDGSRFTDLRLSPSSVEWMIGAPAGWSDPDCPLGRLAGEYLMAMATA